MNSPCINLCQLDERETACVGCGRTTGEIGRWTNLTPAERDEILRGLPARLERIKDSTRGD